MITETDKAWVAGVLDSRSTVGEYLQRGKPQWRLSVMGLKSDLTLEELSRLVNVKMTSATDTRGTFSRKACKQHCPSSHVHVIAGPRRPIAYLSGVRVYVVISNVMSYMRSDISYFPKLELHVLGIMANQQASSMFKVVRDLHAIGWDIPDMLSERVKVA